MKIAFVIPTMRMGGAEKSLCNLLNRMADGEDEIDLILFSREGELLGNIPKKVKIYSLSSAERAMVLEWRYYYKALLKPLDIVKLNRRMLVLLLDHIQRLLHFSIVNSWKIIEPAMSSFPQKYDLAIGFLEGTADFYTIDKVTAKKKIGWIHIDFNKRRKNLRYDKKYYERFDGIATISETCKKAFIEQFPGLSNRIEVVPNVNDSYFISQQSSAFSVFDQDERYHVVTIGRLEDQKGIDIAIEVAEVLLKKKFPFVWHVYGEGAKRGPLTRKINELSLEDRFLLEGIVENPYPYIRCCDVVVQPSRYEGKSIVLDEAKILCKPIVVTNYPTVRDQITDQKTGLICDFEPHQIADAIMEVCTNQTLAQSLSIGCKIENDACDDGYRIFTDFVKRIVI